MPVLDFKEIREAHGASGQQDQFEQLAEEFLLRLNYRIVEGPSRGADEGKDLIVMGPDPDDPKNEIRWLVSCKHKAYSGNSVSTTDEHDILERVEMHNCHGFIGFYSTPPSSGLDKRLKGLRSKIRTKIIHNENIEAELLRKDGDITLAERYFPDSLDQWLHNVVRASGNSIADETRHGKFTLALDRKRIATDVGELAIMLERAGQLRRSEQPLQIKIMSAYLVELSAQARAMAQMQDPSLKAKQELIWLDEDIFNEKQRVKQVRIAAEQVFVPSTLINSLYMINSDYNSYAKILIRASELISNDNWSDGHADGEPIEVCSLRSEMATMSAKVRLTKEQTQYLLSRSRVNDVRDLWLPGAADVINLPEEVVVEMVVPRVLAKYARERASAKRLREVKEEWFDVGNWDVRLA